jgi:hypothetical protein
MRRKWEKGDFAYFSSRNFLLELSALRVQKKPPKKPHGVRAWTSEPETSVPGVALEKNHEKDGTAEAAWMSSHAHAANPSSPTGTKGGCFQKSLGASFVVSCLLSERKRGVWGGRVLDRVVVRKRGLVSVGWSPPIRCDVSSPVHKTGAKTPGRLLGAGRVVSDRARASAASCLLAGKAR